MTLDPSDNYPPILAPIDLYIDGCHAIRIQTCWFYSGADQEYQARFWNDGIQKWESDSITTGGEDYCPDDDDDDDDAPCMESEFTQFYNAYSDAHRSNETVELLIDDILEVEMESQCMETAGTAHYIKNIPWLLFSAHRARAEADEIRYAISSTPAPNRGPTRRL